MALTLLSATGACSAMSETECRHIAITSETRGACFISLLLYNEKGRAALLQLKRGKKFMKKCSLSLNNSSIADRYVKSMI